jgi:serine phosphatase RsbU (regulator of sigma subunit)/pSer/pThr/pTyr-binding forkhead associated (FHA) protein
MPRLIVENGSESGMVYPMRGEAVTIGRSASSTVQIVDKRVSRHHAVLRQTRDFFVVEDLGSKNGTLLNDEPLIGRVKLAFGDKLLIGDTVITFEREPEDSSSKSRDVSGTSSVKLVPGELRPDHAEQPVEPDTSPLPVAEVERAVLSDPIKRLKVVYQVADSIRSELELDELLRKIMDILWTVVTPHRGIILLADERDQQLEPVVVRTRNETVSQINISRGIVERAMSEKVAILVSDAPSDLRFSANDSVVSGRIRSVICAPLVSKGEVLGVLYVDSQEPGSIYYTNDELDLLTGIANQAATAIANARLHRQAIERQRLEKELEIARGIQMNLLPREYPRIPGVEFAAMSLPARHVGGDYYDFIPMENERLGIVVADVSGKGVAASILTTSIRASLRVEAMQAGDSPVEDIVAAVNEWTCRDATNNMFATMLLAIYDHTRRELSYTNAGHCFPLLFRADGEMETLEVGGCFLGIMDIVDYESATVKVNAGDILVLYSDGVTDAHNSHKQLFGQERLIEVIRNNLSLSVAELRDEIHEATLEFRGRQEQFDDLTILVVKF